MEYKIVLKNIVLYGYHGINKEEKEKGQKFEIDVIITAQLKSEMIHDEISNVIDYCNLVVVIKEIFFKKRCNLIETLANDICSSIIDKFNIIKCEVKIRKPNVNLDCKLDYIEIKVENYGI